MEDKAYLKETERRLAKHVAAGHGKETVRSLRDKANYADIDAGEFFADREHKQAARSQRVADHYDSMRSDLEDAVRSVKEYGQGHNTKALGEGKPYDRSKA